MGINIRQKEYRDSCKNLFLAYTKLREKDGYGNSGRLLLFYAAECGLKCLIMKSRELADYDALRKYAESKGKKEIAGHNIKAMLIFQELDKKFILKDINLLKGGKVPPAEFNQVWRYGANVLDESENDRNEKVLKQIVVYLLQRI